MNPDCASKLVKAQWKHCRLLLSHDFSPFILSYPSLISRHALRGLLKVIELSVCKKHVSAVTPSPCYKTNKVHCLVQ